MIRPGETAPDFTLTDQFGRALQRSVLQAGRHLLLVFYPGDFGPRCSRGLGRFEQLWPRFRELGVGLLAINADRAEVHAGWGQTLGGLSFPVLGDDRPRAEVCRGYGMWREEAEGPDRAAVLVGPDGVVRWVDAQGVDAMHDFGALVARVEETLGESEGPAPSWPTAQALPAETTLFMKPTCPFCVQVGQAITNLHLEDQIALRDLTDDEVAAAELERHSGKRQVPCLVLDGEAVLESAEIIRLLAERTAAVPS